MKKFANIKFFPFSETDSAFGYNLIFKIRRNNNLNRNFIFFSLYKLFGTLDKSGVLQNLNFRFPAAVFEVLFPQLKVSIQ